MYRASRPPRLWAIMFTGCGCVGSGEVVVVVESEDCCCCCSCCCAAMPSASCPARSAIELDGATDVAYTEEPFIVSASFIPCQYCIAGNRVLTRSSAKPRSPWARTMGYLGVAANSPAACKHWAASCRLKKKWFKPYRSDRAVAHSRLESSPPSSRAHAGPHAVFVLLLLPLKWSGLCVWICQREERHCFPLCTSLLW